MDVLSATEQWEANQAFPDAVRRIRMKTDEVVEHICRLPIDFDGGSNSMVQLVAESGVAARPDLLKLSIITSCLADHPEFIEKWLIWSANKRVESGWYLVREADGFVVGFRPKGERLIYSEAAVACAEFVIREVNRLLGIARNKPTPRPF